MFEMMMEKMGFNPKELKKQVDDAAANFNQVIAHFNERLDRLEQTNDRMEIMIKLLLQAVPVAPEHKKYMKAAIDNWNPTTPKSAQDGLYGDVIKDKQC